MGGFIPLDTYKSCVSGSVCVFKKNLFVVNELFKEEKDYSELL